MRYFKHYGVFGDVEYVYAAEKPQSEYDYEITDEEYIDIAYDLNQIIEESQPE